MAVCKTRQEAWHILKEKNAHVTLEEIRQDEDVLDTWASSWLWPLSVFNGIAHPDNREIRYYYPTTVLVTAPEILFFWVARMIMAGYEYRNEKPFSDVYLTGIVRDKKGRKMSKSLGNSPEPLELIEKYGADGVRVGLLFCSPAGNDLLFDENYCEQGRNFANKIWNAYRLIQGWQVVDQSTPERNITAMEWFRARYVTELNQINHCFSQYRLSEALMSVYKLIWDDFCSWYLEMIKPVAANGQSQVIDRLTYQNTVHFFNQLLKMLHPFMPFITEEIWQSLNQIEKEDSIMIQRWPEAEPYDPAWLKGFKTASEIIIQVRNFRQQKQIPFRQPLSLVIAARSQQVDMRFKDIICRLANLSSFEFSDKKPDNAAGFLAGDLPVFIVTDHAIESEKERQRLLSELEYQKGFLQSVMKKLNNPAFLSRARPEVIAAEKKKKADAEQRIQALQEQLKNLV
jgi:valyl-tRNA synthetase